MVQTSSSLSIDNENAPTVTDGRETRITKSELDCRVQEADPLVRVRLYNSHVPCVHAAGVPLMRKRFYHSCRPDHNKTFESFHLRGTGINGFECSKDIMVLNLLTKSILQPALKANVSTSSFGLIGAASSRLFAALDDHTNQWPLINYVQNRGAARKGKRIQRAREARLRAAKRRLLEAQNPKQKLSKRTVKIDPTQLRFQKERELDSTLPEIPVDDVFFIEKFRKKRFSLEEILEFHRQAVHPDVLNKPDSLVQATIELNLKMKLKKKRYIEKLESTVCYPHPFKYEIRQRKIVALCKNEADQQAARDAGAIIVGGMDVVEQLKKNQLTTRDFDHIVCHTDFLLDFASVKGMKGASFFPNKARGNFGGDMADLVNYFKNGIDYSLRINPGEPDYGFVDCYFGKLDMTDEQLRENMIALIQSVSRFKPLNLADGKQFFQRVTITTPATTEMFYLKFWDLTDDYENPDLISDEEEDVDTKDTARAS